ncbi:flagellar basal body-associated FliL family protein [Roseomonas gilardii subsp. gilardii]|uniref:flagellar basal body-associated FliL family protein n=1 Tax=Roseomonas gilardii TaxID=257708 RepID=UPI001FF907E7|nr:flagellar basal body-associated FliL family protein [Roseomonas gilardii]UPG72255.1 flagellar basal body-associated FliL family protein [Roseomonas gilardii subsp. gilardii]
MAKTEKPVEAKGAGNRRKLLLLALPALLLAGGAGAWFSGLLGVASGSGHAEAAPKEEGAQDDGHGADRGAAPPMAVTYLDMPEIMSNLNAPGRRGAFIRLRSKLELARPEDAAAVQQAMPRLLDLFQTYLREMRPEELRGSIGTHRLREELIARANIAAAPARVNDVLFTEILVQ